MKLILLILLLFTTVTDVRAINFQQQTIDEYMNKVNRPAALRDVDGDGLIDIQSSSLFYEDEVFNFGYYRNSGDEFSFQQLGAYVDPYSILDCEGVVNNYNFELYFNTWVNPASGNVSYYNMDGCSLLVAEATPNGLSSTSTIYNGNLTGEQVDFFALGDFNGDALRDFVVMQTPSMAMKVYLRNSNGYDVVEVPLPDLYLTYDWPVFFVQDIDQDGKEDILFSGLTYNYGVELILYSLNNNEFVGATLSEDILNMVPWSVINKEPYKFSDFDGNGTLDLALLERGSNSAWEVTLINQTSPGFFERQDFDIDLNSGLNRKMIFYDVENDGDLDLVYNYDLNISYMVNNNGSFEYGGILIRSEEGFEVFDFLSDDNGLTVITLIEGVPVIYKNVTEQLQVDVYKNTLIDAEGVLNFDAENDGDVDFLAFDSFQHGQLFLYTQENGNFQKRLMFEFTEKIHDIATSDLNGDPFTDLMVVVRGESDEEPYRYFTILFLINDGSGSFQISTSQTLTGRENAFFRDFNNDGQLDIHSYTINQHVWYENRNGLFADSVEIAYPGYAIGSSLERMNDDMHLDLVISIRYCVSFICIPSYYLLYYINDPETSEFSLAQILPTDGAGSVYAIDLNQDKIKEIIVQGVAVFQLNGNQYELYNSDIQLANYKYNIADIDSDGIDDLLPITDHSSTSTTEKVWYKGTGNGNFESLPIGSSYKQPLKNSVYQDFNGDLLVDYISGSSGQLSMMLQGRAVQGSAIAVPALSLEARLALLIMILFMGWVAVNKLGFESPLMRKV